MKKILVVEDDKAINNIICETLKDASYLVDSASDGLEAMLLFMENKYDLVISDIMMPHMDGYELIEKIRQENKYVNIIILSALDEEYDEIKGFDLNIDDYIAKPFSSRLLVKRVEALFRKQDNNKIKNELLDIIKG
ncbi:DNA-binding response OmpR family regulator [Bacilli bacterium PM5-3]|nr:DNA-binding response OmpR family regulator [Bacilli bacterium PM5-3]MDH6603181.1 DNA-binding response OmpR family regulator [Bacilli bacterium PM5-9]